MPNYATATIVGHIGRDPETRQVGDHSVCSFSVAVTKKRKGKDDQTTWFKVSAWNKTGEFVQNYLKKGAAVLVTGDISLDTWTGKDGKAGAGIAIQAQQVVSVGGRSDSHKDVAENTEEELKPADNLNEVKERLAAMQKKAQSEDSVPF